LTTAQINLSERVCSFFMNFGKNCCIFFSFSLFLLNKIQTWWKHIEVSCALLNFSISWAVIDIFKTISPTFLIFGVQTWNLDQECNFWCELKFDQECNLCNFWCWIEFLYQLTYFWYYWHHLTYCLVFWHTDFKFGSGV
jgi:hypothetical protein